MMGLDTRAFVKATPEWREAWVHRVNEVERGRPVMLGLMWEPIGQRNYGLAGGYIGGREPVSIEEAPRYHQEGLEDLPWPGGLVGGMISANGNAPSFRGKAYTNYVEALTGHSLYDACDEHWDGDLLTEITVALEASEADGRRDDFDTPREERNALAAWFRVCVDHDLAVGGDY
jgi:hypothetical protein